MAKDDGNFFTDFPQMPVEQLRDLKRAVDAGYKSFSREYGEGIENFFEPLLVFLVKFEKLLIATPWPRVACYFLRLGIRGQPQH